ncbi:protein kinase [Stieleria sp. ICT_E10.1]|uniref:serine/threonine protein kinase n=1 Tax=Stieleria sedimenti TaxID=2976331 RepID=UPI00217F5925|nr:protein kinase [Stieleria sedimenti]MCS7466568.1 protein kinase [Stieleria sedimenti]
MLTDFGIARVIEESLTATESSILIGTPLYMAPEQANCRRDAIGPASDVYSLGVILYELVFGERPYRGDSAMQVLDRVRAEETIRLPDVSAVPSDIKTICQRCLEHSPESRYPTADALAEDLDRYLRGEAIHTQPIRWWHRFGRWTRQPARIFQAGLISLAIQIALLANFAGVVIGLHQGAFEESVDPGGTSLDIAKVAFAGHAPLLILAVLSFRRIRWSVFPASLLSLITVFVLGRILFNGDSPIELYDDFPAARFLMHHLILVMMSIQTLGYLVAIPAALRRTVRWC